MLNGEELTKSNAQFSGSDKCEDAGAMHRDSEYKKRNRLLIWVGWLVRSRMNLLLHAEFDIFWNGQEDG